VFHNPVAGSGMSKSATMPMIMYHSVVDANYSSLCSGFIKATLAGHLARILEELAHDES
jgi:hypothetical protein